MCKRKTRVWNSYSDDFHQIGKNYKLPEGYKWIRTELWHKVLSSFCYFLSLIFSFVYCKIFLGLNVVNRHLIKDLKKAQGCFIYANHTHSIGDVYNPALIFFSKHIYTVVNSVNYTLPIIGKILPCLGALPIPDGVDGMKEFTRAVEQRYKDGNAIVIYPEAHLWDYYTGIRDFGSTSFRFPSKMNAPVFVLTTTYQKRRLCKKPKLTIYVDGPYLFKGSIREKAELLRKQVYETMLSRSRNSNFKYIEYTKNDSQ